jgi:very-short-patch-repair endonuclease
MVSRNRETLAGFKSVADAANAGLQNMLVGSGYAVELKDRVGKGKTTLEFGMPRVRAHAFAMGMNAQGVDYVERRVHEQYGKALQMTESPIERSMIAALLTGRWAGCDTVPPIIHDARRDSGELLQLGDVVIVPQMAFLKYRLDFGVVIEKNGNRQIIDVEVDGAAFHKDAAKDRFRSAYLNSWNIPTFRFKGSEVHEDACAAADEVISAICMWKAS